MAAPRDTAVVLACNAGYVPYALALLDGLARRHPDRAFDLCLFTDAAIEPPAGLAFSHFCWRRNIANPTSSPSRRADSTRHGSLSRRCSGSWRQTRS